MDKQSILNLKADVLEGKVLNCNSCDYVTDAELKNHYLSDNYNKYLPCKEKTCKYQTEYNNILNKIITRSKTLEEEFYNE